MIDILSVEQVAIAFAFDMSKFWMCVVGSAILGVIIGLIACLTEQDIQYLFISFITGITMGLVVGTMIGAINGIPTEYVTQYKVTVSDQVSMNEFNAKYEIIDQEGRIYTVREREP
jgi:ABC-type uncharacterized transport system permease subunit